MHEQHDFLVSQGFILSIDICRQYQYIKKLGPYENYRVVIQKWEAYVSLDYSGYDKEKTVRFLLEDPITQPELEEFYRFARFIYNLNQDGYLLRLS